MRFLLLLLLLVPPVWSADPGLGDRLASLRGAGALRRDEALDSSCRVRALELAASGELAHVDARGRGPGVQALAEGLPPGVYGEVLGSGPSDEAVWQAWLKSPEHRAVLLEPGWVTWGAAAVPRGGVTVYVVRFWKP